MTGARSMEIMGTLDLHGVTRPLVLTATFNGGYAGMPNMNPHARIGFSAHGSLKRWILEWDLECPLPGARWDSGT